MSQPPSFSAGWSADLGRSPITSSRLVSRVALQRLWREIGDDVHACVERVGRSGSLILGEEVAAFEAELAAWWGVPFAVAVGSGLDALEIALRCAGVAPGQRVLTTPLTAFATTLAILRVGAIPLWCDVDPSGGLDLAAARGILAADAGIRTVLPVHLYGHPLDPVSLSRLAHDFDLTVVEACAQSAGAWREGRATGLVGTASAVSFYPTKNLGALGDGGAVLTSDRGIAEHARVLRDYGGTSRDRYQEPGLNSRLDARALRP